MTFKVPITDLLIGNNDFFSFLGLYVLYRSSPFNSLPPLGNFSPFLFGCPQIFFQINFFKTFFQEYHLSVKQCKPDQD